jgi:hypothetical protein
VIARAVLDHRDRRAPSPPSPGSPPRAPRTPRTQVAAIGRPPSPRPARIAGSRGRHTLAAAAPSNTTTAVPA